MKHTPSFFTQIILKDLKEFVACLNFLTNSEIEIQFANPCDFEFLLSETIPSYLETFLRERFEETISIIGISGMQLLKRFDIASGVAMFCEGDKGWSKKLDWIEFVSLSIQLKDCIEKKMRLYQEVGLYLQKYPKEYFIKFIKNYVEIIAQHNELPIALESEFIVRCQYILENPDEYEGLTWSAYELIKLLYTFYQSAYNSSYFMKERGKDVFTLDNCVSFCAQLIIQELKLSNS